MPRLREADAERRLANGGPNYVEALARGLSVINAFGQERRQLSLSDVARATSLPKASVRRMLHTLITLQLADTDGRVFRLTPRVLGLAGDYLGSNKISTVVQPVCERVARITGRSYLGRGARRPRHGDDRACLAALSDGRCRRASACAIPPSAPPPAARSSAPSTMGRSISGWRS